jgi:alpha-tubulin suppressor-like RCC1 family protein
MPAVELGAPATSLSAWSGTGCALLVGGSLRCWGSDPEAGGYGSLDPFLQIAAPTDIPPIDVGGQPIAISVGGGHSCVLLQDETARCWGSNIDGQANPDDPWDSMIGDDETPAYAALLDLPGPVAEVVAANSNSCARLVDGQVYCWGWSGLSAGLILPEVDPLMTPINLGGPATQIVLEGAHACAVLEGGTLRCWGYNNNGELGYSSTDDVGYDELSTTAGSVDVGGPVVRVSVGQARTCALLEGGAVRCWGKNSLGQLGYGHTNDIGDNETPATAGDLDLGGTAVSVTLGYSHACALLDGGSVRCWGSNLGGQLGYGHVNTIGDDETPATAGAVDLGGVAVEVEAGQQSTCARLEDGSVLCWGFGDGWGSRLGYGTIDTIGDTETPASAGDVAFR